MIQLTFSIKYQSQLRRIRPDIYKTLEDSIINSIKLYGGNVKYEYNIITAMFNKESFGFWLDILSVIETLINILDAVKHELYGYICIISEPVDIDRIHEMLNMLPSVCTKTGIWCTKFIQRNTGSFMEFNEQYGETTVLSEGIAELKSVKLPDGTKNQYPMRKSMTNLFNTNDIQGNRILIGKDFIGKRDFMHWYCRNFGNFSIPLTIRFGSWGFALNCFSDALSPDMRQFLETKNIPLPKEMDDLSEALSVERMCREYSVYSLQKA